MYRFLLFFSLLLLCSFFQAKGQDFVSMTEKVKLEKDTVWIVNQNYDEYHHTLRLTLDFSEQSPRPKMVRWGHDSQENQVSSNTLTYSYPVGLYTLEIVGNDDKVYRYRVFNKRLSVDFEIVPKPFEYCFEKGGDSLLIVRSGIEQNMPETVYDIVVDGPEPIEDSVTLLCKEKTEWFGPNLDSAWVVFNQQTGTKKCEVSIKMTYENEGKTIKLEEETDPKRLSIFRAPNVKKIIGFSEPEKDSAVVNIEICSNQVWNTISDDILSYYQYKRGGGMSTPYYEDYAHRQDFDMRYWYSDTVYDGMPESRWREVTGMEDTVSTSKDISFFMPGYYKMMITAKNMCNDVAGVKYDTLWTDRVSWDETHELRRYFQVFSGDSTKLVCKDSILCMSTSKDSIVFVDYNVRRGYEAPPKYEVKLMNPDSLKQPEPKDAEPVQPIQLREPQVYIYRGGKIVEEEQAQECGCDSTVIIVRLSDYKFYGVMELQVTKSGQCSSGSSAIFKVKAGRAPKDDGRLSADLFQDLGDYGVMYLEEEQRWVRCDTFRYAMPLDSLLLREEYMWGFELDSVRFALKQGSADSTIIYYRRGGTKDLSFLFDSTEVQSSITYKSYNRCGWGDGAMDFQVYGKPNVQLWRDSIAENDSLCVDMAYPYFWEGTLPPQYEIYLFPKDQEGNAIPMSVNGKEKKGQTLVMNGDTILYATTGTVKEEILIHNVNFRRCNMQTTLDLEVLEQPDMPVFADSVGICEGLETLDARKLFKAEESDFKRAEWQLNGGTVSKENFPKFTLSENSVDTLHYTLSQSKGCYVKGDLLVRPQTVPTLELQPDFSYCLPDSVKSLREADFVQSLSAWAGYNSLKVFKDVVNNSPYYDEGTQGVYRLNSPYIPVNNQLLIYEMVNLRVDTAFMGKCRVRDTVALQVSEPKLQVMKDDTLTHPWEWYEFNRMKGHIDTLALNKASLKWTLQPDKKLAGTQLFEAVYNLEEAEKARDTLLFEVSALNYCGKELKDTLFVRLNHLKLKAYTDTICSNTEGYRLWNKVDAAFVNPESVKWEIVWPPYSQGALSGEGVDVTYAPAGLTTGDSVRIAVSATLLGADAVTTKDTVVLKINKAPIFQFVKDTLWACGDRVNIAALREDKSGVIVVKENIGKLPDGQDGIIKGNWVDESKGQCGNWSLSDYVFSKEQMAGRTENATQKVSYQAYGLKGCADVLDSVVLLNPVRATIEFERKTEEMCAGERILLDTLYTVKGGDQFTYTFWEQGDKASGHIEEEKYYVANFPQDSVQKLFVSTYKEYTCYTGASSGKVLETPHPYLLHLTVHREPEFTIAEGYQYDTLCNLQSEIILPQVAVETKKSYPDYRDSVLVNGLRLHSDGLKFEHTRPGEVEKYVVTVLQGRCTNWKEKSDTIYRYRLPEMITGSIPEMTVCEGSDVQVDFSQLRFDHLGTDPNWSATGGQLSHEPDGTKRFKPNAGLHQEGTVTVTVNPPHGCPAESKTGSVKVGRHPQLQQTAYVFCKVAGGTETVSAELTAKDVQLDRIAWYRVGATDVQITSGVQTNWNLELAVTAEDLTKSPLLLRAEMHCSGACSGVFNDTVSITWQEAPEVSIEPDITVCQASPTGVALGQKVQVKHGNISGWNLVTTDKGTWNEEGLTFVPGDGSGTANVQVTVAGLATCPGKTETVEIDVLAAPASGIDVTGERCSTRELVMTPQNERADDGYAWNFGDGNQAEGALVKKSYAQVDTYTVTMTGQFKNGCRRVETKDVTVYLRPTADFSIVDPAPINQLIEMKSLSTPENVACHWQVDGSATYEGSPVSPRFVSEGTHSVQLVAETPEGCKDTLLKRPTVLAAPVADFRIKVDSCAGVVEITNQSDLHGATIAWDFGNGQSISNTEHPSDQHYAPIYRDTTYTISLTLTNVSGVQRKDTSFVVKSLLAPAFELLTNDPCSKVAKKIEVKTRGEADTTYLDWGDGTKEYWTKEDARGFREHKYPANSTWAEKKYTLTLRPVNACHRDQSVSKELSVIPSKRELDLQDSSHYKGCYGFDWEFRKRSYGFLEDGYMCTWDFGDGGRRSNPADTVTYLYERPGEYMVIATVEDRCESLQDTLMVKVVGNDSLDFVLEKEVACVGDTVEIRFVQRGKEPFTGLIWKLPEQFSETLRDEDVVKYVCRYDGSKKIELTAAASACPRESISHTLRVAKTPQVEITRGNPEQDTVQCVPFGLRLWALDWNDCDADFRWDFGNGDLSSERNWETIYREPGRYTVRLTMTTLEGCMDMDTLAIVAKKTPMPALALKDSLVCSTSGTFMLTAYNRTEAMEENTYRWMRSSQSVVLSHYPDTVAIPFAEFWGEEEIRLIATNRETLCSDTARVVFVMSEPVRAGLEVIPDTVCAGTDVVFRDTTPRGVARTFLFEDGDAETADRFERYYPEAGKYPYLFAVENAQGCRDTLRDTVVVYTLPVVDFMAERDNTISMDGLENEVSADIENGGVRFADRSWIRPFQWEPDSLYYAWDFGDGKFSAEKNPVHSYDNNGNYEVWLRVTSAMGCCDSISDVVSIAAIKGLYFPNAMVPASSDEGVNRFQPKGVGLHSYVVRIFTPNGGTCVWQSDKLNAGKPAEYWDGTFNGQPVAAGLYIWEASATFIDGSFTGHLNGVVNVIR